MQKIISILMSAIIISGIMVTPAFAAENVSEKASIIVSREDGNLVTTITGKENIKAYQESLGEEYDPNLIAIRRTIKNSYPNENEITPFFIFREYYIKNKEVTTSTDFSTVLREYIRPAGNISISEGVDITTSYTADAGISADILEAKLGFSVSSTDTFQIEWSGSYSYPIRIKVYPIYEKITGEIWGKDIEYDDFVGRFIVKRALGDDVRVYRR